MIDKLLAKTAYEILSRQGRGSDFPGMLGLKLNKKFIKGFEKPPITIFVTGTAGKTTVAGILKSALTNCGYRVGTNDKGSNLSSGAASALVANSTLTGKSKVDVLVIEIDERYFKLVAPYLKPDYFIITNLSRDQLARNGHFDIVFDDINDYIDDASHLILNADNPMSSKFALGRGNEMTYFGVARNEFSGLDYRDKLDVSNCPACGSGLVYDYFNYGNFGSYHCPCCDFKRNQPEYEASFKGDEISIEGQSIHMLNNAAYNVYNIAAVYTQMRLLGITAKECAKALNNLNLVTSRYEQFSIGDKQGTILLSKNETPMSYNQSLQNIARIDGDKTVAIGFTRISGRYDDKDISWFYDVDYEALANTGIKRLVLFGKYAYDLAVRLQLAGMDPDKFQIELNPEKVYEVLKACDDDLYCVFYFDMEKKLKKQLKEAGEKLW